MAKILCIPLEQAKKLRQALVKKEINMDTFFETPSKKRLAILEQYVDTNMAKFVNREFSKALKSEQDVAIDNWINENFRDKNDKEMAIKEAKNITGLITPETEAQLEDLVRKKLGIDVTPDEVAKITDLSNDIEAKYKEAIISDIVNNKQAWIDLYKAQDNMNKYLQSRTPTPIIELYLHSVSRVPMLLSLASTLLNVQSNSILLSTIKAIQGIETLGYNAKAKLKGEETLSGFNRDYAKQWANINSEIFHKTGFDTSRMDNIDDLQVILGEKIKHFEGGKGRAGIRTRKVLKGYSRIVYHYALGHPDVFFASSIFAGSANLESSKIALQEGYRGQEAKDRALEIFKDAVNVHPKTEQGVFVREISKQNAKFFTLTNKGALQKLSTKMRGFINFIASFVGLRGAGELAIPFANTPANAVERNIDATGITVIPKLILLKQAIKEGDKIAVRRHSLSLYLAGFGWLAALLIKMLLKPDDHIGPYVTYSPKQRELIKAKNGVYNSIRIGGTWISLDYLSFVGLNLALLNLPKDFMNNLIPSGIAIKDQLFQVPGISEIKQILGIEEIRDADDIAQAKDEFIRGTNDFVISRIIPAFIPQILQTIDGLQRETRGNTLLESSLNAWKAKLNPSSLPPKIDMFGKTPKQSGLSLIFGQRVRWAENNDLINELNRLNDGGQLPNIKDVRYYNKTMKLLKPVVESKQFLELFKDITTRFRDTGYKLINNEKYIKATDAKKKEYWEYYKNQSVQDGVNKMFPFGSEARKTVEDKILELKKNKGG